MMDADAEGGRCLRHLCRHCARFKINRPRRLCFTCFGKVEIRELYPKGTNGRQSRGLGNGNCDPPPPLEPTRARQGSEEKIRVLMARAAAGRGLFHPLDGSDNG